MFYFFCYLQTQLFEFRWDWNPQFRHKVEVLTMRLTGNTDSLDWQMETLLVASERHSRGVAWDLTRNRTPGSKEWPDSKPIVLRLLLKRFLMPNNSEIETCRTTKVEFQNGSSESLSNLFKCVQIIGSKKDFPIQTLKLLTSKLSLRHLIILFNLCIIYHTRAASHSVELIATLCFYS